MLRARTAAREGTHKTLRSARGILETANNVDALSLQLLNVLQAAVKPVLVSTGKGVVHGRAHRVVGAVGHLGETCMLRVHLARKITGSRQSRHTLLADCKERVAVLLREFGLQLEEDYVGEEVSAGREAGLGHAGTAHRCGE